MRRRGVSGSAVGFLILAVVSLAAPGFGATMYDYCQIPPYVNQLTPPNVMILMDTSGSMFNFAYDDNVTGQQYQCYNAACSNYLPSKDYYGYFNSSYWYTYSTNLFEVAGPKYDNNGNPTRPNSNTWDGNFLNWLTMRRVDVLRKVLTGGRPSADKLDGQAPDDQIRGYLKSYSNVNNVTPFSGNKTFTFLVPASQTGNPPATFSVSGESVTYRVEVRVPLPVEGVLQTVIREKARIGLAVFNPPKSGSDLGEGGQVLVSVGGGSLPSVINQINLTNPNSNTELGEALWTIAGYFARQSAISGVGSPGPMYHSADYQVNAQNDPLNYGSGGSPRYPY